MPVITGKMAAFSHMQGNQGVGMSEHKPPQSNLHDPEGRYAVVASRFNEFVVEPLLEGALATLKNHGVPEKHITVLRVPGAWELPIAVKHLLAKGKFDAAVALGAVIRGGTPHFDYVSAACTEGLAQVSLETGVPVALGVLTTDTDEQAVDRAGGKAGNKGVDASMAALEMASLLRAL
jgi:6,7-dimethyl-8-ribityllumazine synthase